MNVRQNSKIYAFPSSDIIHQNFQSLNQCFFLKKYLSKYSQCLQFDYGSWLTPEFAGISPISVIGDSNFPRQMNFTPVRSIRVNIQWFTEFPLILDSTVDN